MARLTIKPIYKGQTVELNSKKAPIKLVRHGFKKIMIASLILNFILGGVIAYLCLR
jgi:hypothetical protein